MRLACLLLITATLATVESGRPDALKNADLMNPGSGCQRTMTLLATSTPERRNRVRILFYGQSITEQAWWKTVVDELRRRYPHAEIEAANRAIGGFAAQQLERPAEHDLYPWYPDLLIFHVYGANDAYARIIAEVRRRTAAEVLMQTDHVTAWPPTVVDQAKDKGAWWDHMMNTVFLPGIARTHGCGLVDVRGGWIDALRKRSLEPKALLKDGVHLNAEGEALMAELVLRHLVHSPTAPDAAWRGLMHEHPVTDAWRDGRLALALDGNRIEVVPAPGGATVRVLIDGKPPSSWPDAHVITRPSPTQAGFWPALSRVGHERPLLPETWTLRVLSSDDAAKAVRFSVTGAVTGEDGEGSSLERFVSKSGRVVIEPGDWNLAKARSFTGKTVATGFTVTWSALLLGTDTLQPPAAGSAGEPRPIVLAQHLPNGPHRLELIADQPGPCPVRVVRSYQPPGR